MFSVTRRLAMNQGNPFSKLFQQQPGFARLAVLQPGENNAPLKITLADSKLTETSYECLSFDRSKDNDLVEIDVGEQKQAIPKYLESGLRAFRRKDRPRTLWADLLIGDNAEERSKQASTMRMILENAERTLCWTGVDNTKTAVAFGIIREMTNRWTRAATKVDMPLVWSRASTQQMQSVMDDLRSCPDGDLDSFNHETWNEIFNIFGSPYWRSVQCLPEIVLSKKAIVVCGRSNISWQDFHCALQALAIFQGRFFGATLPQKVLKNFSIIHGIEIAERRRRNGDTIELMPMIMSARDADPKDPRESVFSMLPIVTPSARLQFHKAGKPTLPSVDYTKNVQQVFTEAAAYIVRERQDLFLWSSERSPCAKRIKGLPSWVPDFSLGNGGIMTTGGNPGLRRWWDKLEDTKHLKVNEENNSLHVQAFPLDKITYLSPPFHAGNCRRLALKEWRKLMPSSNPSTSTSTSTTTSQKESFWRTLLCNNTGFGETMTSLGVPTAEYGVCFESMLAEEEILETLDCTMDELREGKPEVIARLDRNDPRMQEAFSKAGTGQAFEQAMKGSWGRRFFRTEAGRFGMTSVESFDMTDPMYRVSIPDDVTSATETSNASTSQNAGEGSSTSSNTNTNASQVPPTTNQTDTNTNNEPNPPPSKHIGDLMADPLARAMLESFQRYLSEKDPAAAKLAQKMMRGEFDFQEQQAIDTVTDAGGAVVGDVIVACIGGFLPYVLRPKGATDARAGSGSGAEASSSKTASSVEAEGIIPSDSTYEYIGDCYLHGVMDAEPFIQTNFWGKQMYVTDMARLVDITLV